MQIQRPVRQRRTNKRVRFSNAQVVGTVINRSSISIVDHRNMWYFAHELESFKSEIRNACQQLQLRRNENQNNNHTNRLASGNTAAASSGASTIYSSNNINIDINIINTEFESFPTRGLEQRMCKNRQRDKALAIWGTLKAQQRNNDPEFIAMIARKCSYTASQLAYMEAAKDYCEIYNPEAIPSLSAEIELFSSHSFPINLKRKAPEDSSAASVATNISNNNTNGRNVRIRIN